MVVFTISCALVGAVLGLRYKVLALVPAVGVAMMVVLITGIARGDSGWLILGAAATAATVLQIGYLAGTLTRFAIAGAPLRPASTPVMTSHPAEPDGSAVPKT
jgi:hypothetical protein